MINLGGFFYRFLAYKQNDLVMKFLDFNLILPNIYGKQ